jgi:hypothetical protein
MNGRTSTAPAGDVENRAQVTVSPPPADLAPQLATMFTVALDWHLVSPRIVDRLRSCPLLTLVRFPYFEET